MEHKIDPLHGITHAINIAHITDIELHTLIFKAQAHIFLFFFIAAKNPDLTHLRMQKTLQNSITEWACSASN